MTSVVSSTSIEDFEKAIEQFSLAIETSESPDHVLFSNRSDCYASLKNFSQALKDAKEDSPVFQYKLSSFDDAKAAYKKALELNPADTMTQNGLSAVESAKASRNAAPDMGIGKIFLDPNLITELREQPQDC